jgi:TolB-like protein
MSGGPTSSDTQVAVGLLLRNKKAVLTVAALALMVLVGLGYGVYRWLSHSSGSAIDTLAVLPFTNVTGDPNTEYLSDGLTESLIGSLAQLPNLTVRPRSSVFRYKSKDVEVQKVADELQVGAVVTGRVTQHGDSLLVSAELTDARKNRSLWSEQYDRKISDALNVQREIAGEISARLRERLTGEQKTQLTKGGTNNPEAYEMYLKGRYYWDRRTPDALAKSKEYFQQAIEKDPNYALAYVGMASYYGVLPIYTNTPGKDIHPKGKAAAERAIAIDETLPEAHALLESFYDKEWNWAAAEREFQRALKLDPNSARTHVLYGIHLEYLGKMNEALEHFRRAVELDPLNANALDNLAEVYIYTRQYAQTIEEGKKLVELDSAYANVHFHLAVAYYWTGKYDLWLDEWEKVATLNNDTDELAVAKGAREEYFKSGLRSAEKRILELREEQSKRTYFDPALLATSYAQVRDKENAFRCLENAYVKQSEFLTYIKTFREFDSLRSDPRYTDLLHRMNLPL